MTVQDNYRRTMQAEGVDMRDVDDFDKSEQYTLSSDIIRDVYADNKEICERKGLTIEQTLDSFVTALVDKGMPMDEAEEVCEMYDRTDGEYFSEDGDKYMDDDEDDDDDCPHYDDDDFEDEDDRPEIIEV